jgi:nucleoside-diphosphate-sugar epimerase
VTNNMIAVVGATGLVGREVISVLGNKDHPGEAILALATARTEGEEIDFLEETLPVEQVGSDSFRGVKAAVRAHVPLCRATRFRRRTIGACSGGFTAPLEVADCFRGQRHEIPQGFLEWL